MRPRRRVNLMVCPRVPSIRPQCPCRGRAVTINANRPRKYVGTSLIRAAVVVPALFAALSGQAGPAYASHAVTYQVGDVFAGTGQGGGVPWRHSNGTVHSVPTAQAA